MGPNPGCNQGTAVQDLVVVRFNFEMYNCLENNKQRTKRRFGVILSVTCNEQLIYTLVETIRQDKFQSLNINPRKLDKKRSDKTLTINELDIANTELKKLLAVHIDENLTLLSILANYVLRQFIKLEYSHVFEILYPARPSHYCINLLYCLI